MSQTASAFTEAINTHLAPDLTLLLNDGIEALIAKQREELSGSRWHSVFSGLPHHIAWRIHLRLEELQRTRPLTGAKLRSRCGGVKTTILHNIVNNSRWGRSRGAIRAAKHRKIYNPYNNAFLKHPQKQHVSTQYHTATGSATDE